MRMGLENPVGNYPFKNPADTITHWRIIFWKSFLIFFYILILFQKCDGYFKLFFNFNKKRLTHTKGRSQDDCIKTKSGFYQTAADDRTADATSLCPAGRYCNAGSYGGISAGLPCPVGTYNEVTGISYRLVNWIVNLFNLIDLFLWNTIFKDKLWKQSTK